jgi:ribosomal protein S18 acetylase RimI-like enzyme
MGVDYNIHRINAGDTSQLDQFIHSAGSSLRTFRYFQNRPYSVLENHLVTCLLMNENKPIGYGHLDRNGDTVWLGIAVAEVFKGMGLGKLIMDFLVSTAKSKRLSKVKLTVDDGNIPAISFYKKFGFISQGALNENCLLMELEISYE